MTPLQLMGSPIRVGHLFQDDAYLSSSCSLLVHRNYDLQHESHLDELQDHAYNDNEILEQSPYFQLQLSKCNSVSYRVPEGQQEELEGELLSPLVPQLAFSSMLEPTSSFELESFDNDFVAM